MIRICTLLVFIGVHTLSSAAPFDDSPALQRQYEEFRQQDDGDDHRPVTNDNDMAEVFLVYGKKALEEGDAETALNHLRAGKELSPDDGRFSMMLGLVYSRIGDNVLAENNLLLAVQLLPETAEPLRLLVDHYYRAGQLPEAAAALQRLLQLVPEDVANRERLERIQREIGVEADMVRDVNSIFSIKFDESVHAELADRFVDILQDAYAEQGSLLDYYPQKTIQVILYTRDDYDMTTGAPAWSAGRFDGKIRMPISMKHVGRVDFGNILRHEYNHFIAQQLSRGKAPAWFYEGLAMIAAERASLTLKYLPSAVRSGGLMDFKGLEKSFDRLDAKSAYLAYEHSYSFVRYLLQQFGWHTLRDILSNFGRGLDVNAAFASVFNDFGLDFEKLQSEWIASL